MTQAGAPPPAAGTADREPLDRVMLAMDVVDTLRHQREVVERELDDERRQREFTAQVQAIYDAQGIDVPADVIAEAVAALRQDRFVYSPPARTLSVRLAEVYVERGRWARRAGIAAALLALLWAAWAIPSHYARRALVDGFAADVARTTVAATSAVARAGDLREELQQLRQGDDSPAGRQIFANAEAELERGQRLAAAVRDALQPPPDPEGYPDARETWDPRLEQLREDLAAAGAALGAAGGMLEGVRVLRSLAVRLEDAMARLRDVDLTPVESAEIESLRQRALRALASGSGGEGLAALAALQDRIDRILAERREQASLRQKLAGLSTALAGVDVEPAARRSLADLRATAEQAVAAGDWARAATAVARLDELTAQVDRSYELRIVSRPGVQSGVWRESRDHPGGRNHYLIVEAIGPDGRALALPVTSEEDQRTSTVRTFGVRVPEQVYERVRRDKSDDGIVDDAVIATKRRGALEPDYHVEVLGGRITSW